MCCHGNREELLWNNKSLLWWIERHQLLLRTTCKYISKEGFNYCCACNTFVVSSDAATSTTYLKVAQF